MPQKRGKKKEEERTKETSPTVFTAAGLLAFSEEDALVKIRPVHVLIASLTFIAAVILANVVG